MLPHGRKVGRPPSALLSKHRATGLVWPGLVLAVKWHGLYSSCCASLASKVYSSVVFYMRGDPPSALPPKYPATGQAWPGQALASKSHGRYSFCCAKPASKESPFAVPYMGGGAPVPSPIARQACGIFSALMTDSSDNLYTPAWPKGQVFGGACRGGSPPFAPVRQHIYRNFIENLIISVSQPSN